MFLSVNSIQCTLYTFPFFFLPISFHFHFIVLNIMWKKHNKMSMSQMDMKQCSNKILFGLVDFTITSLAMIAFKFHKLVMLFIATAHILHNNSSSSSSFFSACRMLYTYNIYVCLSMQFNQSNMVCQLTCIAFTVIINDAFTHTYYENVYTRVDCV